MLCKLVIKINIVMEDETMIEKKPTYISLFSSAGIGCYGFKMAGFKCIATNELMEKRLNIQKINNKCDLDSGYILGDITLDNTKQLIFDEINKWGKKGNDKVDVVIATPPCQGMSIANHKKNITDYNRNSLVVESIELIKKIKPRFFIFENVSAFMKTVCEAPDGTPKAIEVVIREELGSEYCYLSRNLNFKNYGSNSSRTRTVVIGVKKELADFISPIELYPLYKKEKTLKEALNNLKDLSWDEFDNDDFYHQFRTYPKEMRTWISNTHMGCSAFDNANMLHKPHKIIDNKYIENVRKNGDKYKRQHWDKVAPCVHTRNDQLASQNTIHPIEDRVFSIRELMRMLSIPDSFKWIDMNLSDLNKLELKDKKLLLRKNEINIRQSLGEAVPTEIFHQIASNINKFLFAKNLTDKEIYFLIEEKNLNSINELIFFIKSNEEYSLGTLSRIVELSNTHREKTEAFFTNKSILNDIYKELPNISKNTISVLEPSVGIGNFIPFIARKYEDKEKINIDVFDINPEILLTLKELIKKYELPSNVHISYNEADTLLYSFNKHYDLVIGNPPFANAKEKKLTLYKENAKNKSTKNLASFFLEKSMHLGDYVVMISPKTFLNTPEFKETRALINNFNLSCVIDFGEKGFKNVLVETVCFIIDTLKKIQETRVISISNNIFKKQKQSYITDNELPYWIIYRDENFDKVFNNMKFNIFSVFRDRQITNSNSSFKKEVDTIRVIKSRNISYNGKDIIDIPNYDAYIKHDILDKLLVNKYMNDDTVYLTPNMTYKPRVCRKPKGVIINGSVAILIPKHNIELSEDDMLYYSTNEYREFYKIARNYQTRSLNIDKSSVFFFGVKLNHKSHKGGDLCDEQC
jgi:DNA (cytosine-5)-methyltransferase 1